MVAQRGESIVCQYILDLLSHEMPGVLWNIFSKIKLIWSVHKKIMLIKGKWKYLS